MQTRVSLPLWERHLPALLFSPSKWQRSVLIHPLLYLLKDLCSHRQGPVPGPRGSAKQAGPGPNPHRASIAAKGREEEVGSYTGAGEMRR